MNLSTPALQTAPPPAPVNPCRLVRFLALPGLPKSRLSCCPLPLEAPREALLAEFQAAPQFSQIRLPRLMEEHRGSLRVLLLGESTYYACQAAVYLTTLFQTREDHSAPERDSFWDDALWDLLDPDSQDTPGPQLSRSLAVLSPALLDPSLEAEPARRPALSPTERPAEQFELSRLDAPAALVAADSGPVLSRKLLDRLEELSLRDAGHPLDLFLALKPHQLDLELLEELRFTYGFQVCRVGQPDQDYLRRVLRSCGEELLTPIDQLADLDQVIAHTRRCRGSAFQETDLESLVLWAIQRRAQPPLTTRDLLFSPFQSKREGWKQLEAMTGLQPVKESLRRLLATAALEGRRRQQGLEVRPVCRSLAFSGPPGTGKSVTARLAAQILREEGCGTGRFVEAGREQLIGTYLGETSPKIAALFQRARGGVLFIDEAGALLDGGQDIYAVEAVNALVRHMELDPETMVIFATYPGEMERLLASNPGLSSRIAQVLEFPAYDGGQLWEIFQSFARAEGYALPEGAEELCDGFFSRLRQADPESFGNGREARRLFQGAVEELALRTLSAPGEGYALSLQDLEHAADRLLVRPGGERRRTIVF